MRGNTEILFERDEASGTVTTFCYDESNDTFTLREQQNVEHILEINKFLRALGRPKSDIRHIGQIPMTVLGQMMTSWRQRGLTREERQVEFAAWLNNSDNAAWRSDNGRSRV